MNTENEWGNFFDNVFDRLKIKFKERHPFEEDGEVSPEILAMRDAIFKLPCPVKVLELRFDKTNFANIKDGIGYVLRYDLSRMGENLIENYGMIDVEKKDDLKSVLIDKYDFPEDAVIDFISSFKTMGIWDSENLDYYIHFVQYDIRRYFDEYLYELLHIFLYNIQTHLIQKFKKEIDFNILYDLKDDTILKWEEFTIREPVLDSRIINIEVLQKDICAIQLIPAVPEEVKRIFKAAKDLYVFGFFRWYFFTISNHYSYLAIESAIKHRYNQWLGEKVELTCTYKRDILRHEIIKPSFEKIFEFCKLRKKQGWDCRELMVSGEHFPFKMELLLNWLLEKGIQTKWQRDRLKFAIDMRNTLSHLESVTILWPNSIELKIVAEQINTLYHHQHLNEV